MRLALLSVHVCWLAIFFGLLACSGQTAETYTKNAILITLDGARREEIFGGLDLEVLKSTIKNGAVEETRAYKNFWAATPFERRLKLMPFFWGVLMREHGSIAGNLEKGSVVRLSNRHHFSYPGYSEILTGQAHDEVINSNKKQQNPYPTVLEFLRQKLGLKPSEVAAFACWDVLDAIVEQQPGSITANAGFESYASSDPLMNELNRLQQETFTPWDTVRHDAYTFRFAMHHLQHHQPRILYLALGETDDWAHDGRYDRVLDALHQNDQYLEQLWTFLHSHDQYRGKTTLLLTTDHGRGHTPEDWRNHGEKVDGAQFTWLVIISPDVDLRGEWTHSEIISPDQIAASLCRFFGLNYREQNPDAGQPIQRLFKK